MVVGSTPTPTQAVITVIRGAAPDDDFPKVDRRAEALQLLRERERRQAEADAHHASLLAANWTGESTSDVWHRTYGMWVQHFARRRIQRAKEANDWADGYAKLSTRPMLHTPCMVAFDHLLQKEWEGPKGQLVFGAR